MIRYAKVGGGVTAQCTCARASPVSLPRKPLSPVPEVASKTGLSLSRSLVHRQTWRLNPRTDGGSEPPPPPHGRGADDPSENSKTKKDINRQ